MTAADEWLTVDSLDLEAQGVAHNAEGKVVFVDGALPGEVVQVTVQRRKNNWEQATAVAWRRESSQRVRPQCRHFGTCGGCKMQHLHVAAQVATKQRALEDALWHLGKVKAEQMLRPIEGPAWGYRFRARLSVRYVHKKGEVLVGFHERKSRYVADIRECPVLPPHVDAMLMPLRALIFSRNWISSSTRRTLRRKYQRTPGSRNHCRQATAASASSSTNSHSGMLTVAFTG